MQKKLELTFQNVRLNFPSLFVPRAVAGTGSKEVYSTQAIIPVESYNQHAEVIGQFLSQFSPAVKATFPLVTGGEYVTSVAEDKRDKIQPSDIESYYVLKTSRPESFGKPPVVKIVDGGFAVIEEKAEIYSGVIGDIGVTFYVWNWQSKQGISATVGGFKKVSDGERWDGTPDLNAMFGNPGETN